MALINDTISESAGQYERMQQAEAAGHVGDLRGALASVKQIERLRSALFHQAVHDLKNDVLGVNLAASQLGQPAMADTDRVESQTFLMPASRSPAPPKRAPPSASSSLAPSAPADPNATRVKCPAIEWARLYRRRVSRVSSPLTRKGGFAPSNRGFQSCDLLRFRRLAASPATSASFLARDQRLSGASL